ncbi:MAG: cob(I)yrinic acid a,c-diamide adenosyltransferase [Candidatus Omnitrophica bacterium]|nr:cob(I)yrinic acid a,c-diamide adenosyltransferase [Candidatus Omnitrophota bacterium]
MRGLKLGLVQVYTGSGKGKTTAALGLALRASGAGLKVSIQQFAKSGEYCEIKALRRLGNIKVSQCGSKCFIKGRPDTSDIECARRGLKKAKGDIFSGKFDLVILDEVNVAMKLKLIKIKDVIDVIKRRPKSVELVLTGRDCPASIKKMADLVTEMREIRHPYKRGINARRGIEY